jgi:uncharacterized protein (DUF58 family)
MPRHRPPSTTPSASPVDLLAKSQVLHRLELEILRRLDGRISGERLTRVAGAGSERSGARRYEPGDDARRIDWTLTARSQELMVRTTDADRELDTTVVVDRSPSLDFGTAKREKREVVLAALAGFGILTGRAGNRLSVVVAGGDELLRLPPRIGRTGLLAALSSVYDTPRRERPPAPGADLAAALAQVSRTKRQRGQVVVVSDFLDRSTWPDQLRKVALHHAVTSVHVSDPRERQLAPVGMLAVVDAETGRRVHVQTSSSALRARYAAAAGERHDRIVASIRRSGSDYLHLSTDRDWVLDLVRHLTSRQAMS